MLFERIDTFPVAATALINADPHFPGKPIRTEASSTHIGRPAAIRPCKILPYSPGLASRQASIEKSGFFQNSLALFAIQAQADGFFVPKIPGRGADRNFANLSYGFFMA